MFSTKSRTQSPCLLVAKPFGNLTLKFHIDSREQIKMLEKNVSRGKFKEKDEKEKKCYRIPRNVRPFGDMLPQERV